MKHKISDLLIVLSAVIIVTATTFAAIEEPFEESSDFNGFKAANFYQISDDVLGHQFSFAYENEKSLDFVFGVECDQEGVFIESTDPSIEYYNNTCGELLSFDKQFIENKWNGGNPLFEIGGLWTLYGGSLATEVSAYKDVDLTFYLDVQDEQGLKYRWTEEYRYDNELDLKLPSSANEGELVKISWKDLDTINDYTLEAECDEGLSLFINNVDLCQDGGSLIQSQDSGSVIENIVPFIDDSISDDLNATVYVTAYFKPSGSITHSADIKIMSVASGLEELDLQADRNYISSGEVVDISWNDIGADHYTVSAAGCFGDVEAESQWHPGDICVSGHDLIGPFTSRISDLFEFRNNSAKIEGQVLLTISAHRRDNSIITAETVSVKIERGVMAGIDILDVDRFSIAGLPFEYWIVMWDFVPDAVEYRYKFACVPSVCDESWITSDSPITNVTVLGENFDEAFISIEAISATGNVIASDTQKIYPLSDLEGVVTAAVSNGPNNPPPSLLEVEDTISSIFHNVHEFQIEVDPESDELIIEDLVLKLKTANAEVQDVVKEIEIEFEGDIFDDWSYVTFDGNDVLISIDTDGDLIIESGDTLVGEVRAKFYAADEVYYNPGEKFQVEINQAEINAWQVDGISVDISGSSTGSLHTLVEDGATVSFIDSQAEILSSKESSPNDTGRFTIEVQVDAMDDPVYIPIGPEGFSMLVISEFEGIIIPAEAVSAGFTDLVRGSDGQYYFEISSTADLEFVVSVQPGEGLYYAELQSISMTSDDPTTPGFSWDNAAIMKVVLDVDEFRTKTIQLLGPKVVPTPQVNVSLTDTNAETLSSNDYSPNDTARFTVDFEVETSHGPIYLPADLRGYDYVIYDTLDNVLSADSYSLLTSASPVLGSDGEYYYRINMTEDFGVVAVVQPSTGMYSAELLDIFVTDDDPTQTGFDWGKANKIFVDLGSDDYSTSSARVIHPDQLRILNFNTNSFSSGRIGSFTFDFVIDSLSKIYIPSGYIDTVGEVIDHALTFQVVKEGGSPTFDILNHTTTSTAETVQDSYGNTYFEILGEEKLAVSTVVWPNQPGSDPGDYYKEIFSINYTDEDPTNPSFVWESNNVHSLIMDPDVYKTESVPIGYESGEVTVDLIETRTETIVSEIEGLGLGDDIGRYTFVLDITAPSDPIYVSASGIISLGFKIVDALNPENTWYPDSVAISTTAPRSGSHYRILGTERFEVVAVYDGLIVNQPYYGILEGLYYNDTAANPDTLIRFDSEEFRTSTILETLN